MGHVKMMEDSLQYSSVNVNDTDIHMSNHKVTDNNIKESHREVRESFKKLRLWGKNLGEFFYISNSINKGIDDLIKEVCSLEAQLAVTTKERNVLIQTVGNLSDEIRNLSAKLSMPQSLPNPGVTHNLDDIEESQEMEATYTDEEDIEGCKMSTINEDEEEHVNYASNDKNPLDSSSIKDLDNIEQEGPDEKLTAAKAERTFYEQNDSVRKDKKFKCEQCPYAAGYSSHIKRHIKVVHEKIRDYICGECDYTASKKINLMRHVKEVHEKVRDLVSDILTPNLYQILLYIHVVFCMVVLSCTSMPICTCT